MRYGLGIDAGGTYTDGVIIDFATQKVLAKNKALTTRFDLGVGIEETMDGLPEDLLQAVSLVSLSTTLATNAIVEGTGNLVGAILLGFDEYDLAKIAHRPVRVVGGRTDIMGEELEPLDEGALRLAVRELEGQEQVAAYALSGMVAVKNPAMELRAKTIVEEMTGKPAVCGHEVSMRLDTIKRTNTAVLNARLLPVIADLLDRIKASLLRRNIRAPLMIVRADGTLMSEASARRHPVQTILSGPAASVCGARFLTGISDGLVVDIGGTTSDIALISDGQPAVSLSGATVANWTTHVRSVDIDTIGLAGDSAVSINRDRLVSLGPRRAVPLAVLGHEHPGILDELECLWQLRDRRSPLVQPVEFFRLVKDGATLYDSERRTLDALSGGPLSRDRLAESLGAGDPSMVPVSRMETLGLIQRSAITPTDVLHFRGVFTPWNAEASRRGLRLFAYTARLDPERLADLILETFTRQSVRALVHRLLRHSSGRGASEGGLLDLLLSAEIRSGLSVKPSYAHPLIAIGAPAWALAPAVAERLGAALVVPEHADVANAVGAITGMQMIVIEAVLAPSGLGFVVHTPAERREFEKMDEARDWARLHVMDMLETRIREEGQEGLPYHREVEVRDSIAQTKEGELFLESVIRAVGVCKPSLV